MYHKRMIRILDKLKDKDFMKKVLLKVSAFSRKQNMTFKEMVEFMIKDSKKSLSNELINYYKDGGKIEKTITKQAFSEQRQNISYEVFNLLNEEFITDYYSETHKTFKGYVVVANDGTITEIPNDPKLKEVYGRATGNKFLENAPARVSASGFYDCLNNIMLVSGFDRYQSPEKEFLTSNIDYLIKLLKGQKILMIFDRGYICTELLILLEEKGIKYLFRCPSNVFKKEVSSAKTKDEIIEIKVDKTKTNSFKILNPEKYLNQNINPRLVRVVLDTGEIEYLMTNLESSEVAYEEMSDLYFQRWKIEKSFDVLKNKLQLENIGARTVNGVKQEFFACILLYNFLEDIRNQMDNDIENNKENKYEYKINMNVLVGTLKNNLITIINNPEDLDKNIELLYNQIKRNLVAIKPNRKNPRNKTRTSNKNRINMRSSF